MSSLEYWAHTYLMVLSYLAPVASVYIAYTERNNPDVVRGGKVIAGVSLLICFFCSVNDSWLSCFGWLVLGTYAGKDPFRVLYFGLAFTMIVDVTLTPWALNGGIYMVAEAICSITEMVDLETGKSKLNPRGMIVWLGLRIAKIFTLGRTRWARSPPKKRDPPAFLLSTYTYRHVQSTGSRR